MPSMLLDCQVSEPLEQQASDERVPGRGWNEYFLNAGIDWALGFRVLAPSLLARMAGKEALTPPMCMIMSMPWEPSIIQVCPTFLASLMRVVQARADAPASLFPQVVLLMLHLKAMVLKKLPGS